jgi:hypothetical protein
LGERGVTDKPDIIERLRKWIGILDGPGFTLSSGICSQYALTSDLADAIAEIEILRRVAGAATRGQSHADIRDKARKG